MNTDSPELSTAYDQLSKIQKKTKNKTRNSRNLISNLQRQIKTQDKLGIQVQKLLADTKEEQDLLKEQAHELKKISWAKTSNRISAYDRLGVKQNLKMVQPIPELRQ